MHLGRSNSNNALKPGTAIAALLVMVGLSLPLASMAQLKLPTTEDVSARVAGSESRQEALFQLAAVARFLAQSDHYDAATAAGLIREDLAWIRRLGARSGGLKLRSPVLDPAAWLIDLELEQRKLQGKQLISPLGPGLESYLAQVFDRSSERLATVMLPELLWQLETDASLVWSRFTGLLDSDGALLSAIQEAEFTWLENWAGSAGDYSKLPPSRLFSDVVNSLDELVAKAIAYGPPDPMRLAQTRFQLLAAMPELDLVSRQKATAFLRLAGLVDGLHEKRYFSFAEGLLALAGSLLNQVKGEPAAVLDVAAWLSLNLPLISSRYARNFSVVDPRLNSALAAVFDAMSGVSRVAEENYDDLALRGQIANASAQLALLIPDLGYYFNLPVRDSIAGGMDACIGMMAAQDQDGNPAMTRDLFDDCQQSMVDLADREARAAALSGDPNGPFGDDQLARELSVTSGQRINYGIGYLHQRYSTGCQKPARPLPNALEWSALATLLAWFAEQAPVYFQTPENEERLERMRAIGRELQQVLAEQVDCFAGAGAAISDPITRSLSDYRDALVTLSSGINGAVFDFRSQVLSTGADVALQRDSTQMTAYRPDKLLIGPCNPENTCEMANSLSSTRALWGLFPNEYLIADQTGLAKIEICYDEMSWNQRRSEYVRPDDTNVANYFGHLQFKLKGRYHSGGSVRDVFGFRFTSPGEHHYLFAAANEEVLNDDCPVEWIGQRIVTPLRNDRGVVPNRLTYLASPRQLPSRLLSNNWDRGAEWRDWFITGIGVDNLEMEPPVDISSEVNQRLETLHRAEQAAIFRSVLQPAVRGESLGIESLFEEMIRLTTAKALIRQQFMIFYPQLLNESEELRSAIAGQGGLLDRSILTRFKSDNVPVDSLNAIAFERLERTKNEWQNQHEGTRRTGSISGSLAHAMMRLNVLYQDFFAEPAQPLILPEPAQLITPAELEADG